jgi:hypothetical protein
MDEVHVDDFILEKRAKELRSQIGTKKKSETPEQTKERMKKTLSQRDAALNDIYDYQDKTGIPDPKEAEKNFYDNEINQKD